MSRYNAWQNNQLLDAVEVMDEDVWIMDRGAFFGSIGGTLSHLLWGDQIWLSRFDARHPTPALPDGAGRGRWPVNPDWRAERIKCDQDIADWADGLTQADLDGNLSWYSGMNKMDLTQPMAQCVLHFFNHQTHHRGQVHAMLTAMGVEAPVSDLAFMPKEA